MSRAIWGIVLSLAAAESSGAATIRVPEDAPSVLRGVDAAAAGDTVLVGPGTWSYHETRAINDGGGHGVATSCAFLKSGVTLLSREGPDETLIASDSLITVVYAGQQGTAAIVEGFTIRAVGAGTALGALNSNQLIVRSCKLTGTTGAAALVIGESSLELLDSEVGFNSVLQGGLYLSRATALVQGTRFEGNAGNAAAVVNYESHATFEGCEFIGNHGPGSGALTLAYPGTTFEIRNCLFLGNVAEMGGGGAIGVAEATGVIDFNVFAYDSCSAPGSGGAIAWDTGSGSIRSNTFYGCYGEIAYGGGSVAIAYADVEFTDNIVAHSTGASAVRNYDSNVLSDCNDYWMNEEGDFQDWTPSPTDIFADPLFCGLDQLDFTLREDSPCAAGNTPGCGQIGAKGVGCAAISVEETSWTRIKALYRKEQDQ